MVVPLCWQWAHTSSHRSRYFCGLVTMASSCFLIMSWSRRILVTWQTWVFLRVMCVKSWQNGNLKSRNTHGSGAACVRSPCFNATWPHTWPYAFSAPSPPTVTKTTTEENSTCSPTDFVFDEDSPTKPQRHSDDVLIVYYNPLHFHSLLLLVWSFLTKRCVVKHAHSLTFSFVNRGGNFRNDMWRCLVAKPVTSPLP